MLYDIKKWKIHRFSFLWYIIIIGRGGFNLSWKNIKIDKINTIEKLISEFEVTALTLLEEVFEGDIIHYGSFKVRIYEEQNTDSNHLVGYTNLKLKDSFGGYEGAVGYGSTIEEALQDTIENFKALVYEFKNARERNLIKEDFYLVNYDEF